MRVLLVHDWVAGEGGAERVMLDARRLLEAAGHRCELLVSSAGTMADGTAEHVAVGAHSLPAQAFLQVANPSAVAAVRRAVRALRPDVALVGMFEMHLSPAVVLALGAAGVPTAGLVFNYKPLCPTGRKLWPDGRLCEVRLGRVCVRTGCVPAVGAPREAARYALIGRALRRLDAVAGCSRWMSRWLREEGIDAVSLPMPVAAPSASFIRAASPTPLFVAAGRLAPEKGVGDLLDALARAAPRHPGLRLRLVGDGPDLPALRHRTAELGLEVDFRGAVPRGAVESELGDAWAAVQPSRWAEPFGLGAAEAIVAGVPVVASAAGGPSEVVEEGLTGLLYPNGDVAALADRLDAVASRRAFPDQRVDAQAAARLAERHTEVGFSRALEALLESARQAARAR